MNTVPLSRIQELHSLAVAHGTQPDRAILSRRATRRVLQARRTVALRKPRRLFREPRLSRLRFDRFVQRLVCRGHMTRMQATAIAVRSIAFSPVRAA